MALLIENEWVTRFWRWCYTGVQWENWGGANNLVVNCKSWEDIENVEKCERGQEMLTLLGNEFCHLLTLIIVVERLNAGIPHWPWSKIDQSWASYWKFGEELQSVKKVICEYQLENCMDGTVYI